MNPDIQRVVIVLDQEPRDLDAVLAHGEVQRLAIDVVRADQRTTLGDERLNGREIAISIQPENATIDSTISPYRRETAPGTVIAALTPRRRWVGDGIDAQE